MTDYKELITALREEAEAVEWEIPICTSNHIREAADAIEQLVADNESYRCAFADLHNEIANYCETIAALEKERDAAVKWHKVTTRPLTAEEKAYYAEMEMDGIEYIFDCEMPEDGQEILVATKWGTDKDICCNDCDYGIGLEGRGDWDGVYAWAEMPQYKEAEHEAD